MGGGRAEPVVGVLELACVHQPVVLDHLHEHLSHEDGQQRRDEDHAHGVGDARQVVLLPSVMQKVSQSAPSPLWWVLELLEKSQWSAVRCLGKSGAYLFV